MMGRIKEATFRNGCITNQWCWQDKISHPPFFVLTYERCLPLLERTFITFSSSYNALLASNAPMRQPSNILFVRDGTKNLVFARKWHASVKEQNIFFSWS